LYGTEEFRGPRSNADNGEAVAEGEGVGDIVAVVGAETDVVCHWVTRAFDAVVITAGARVVGSEVRLRRRTPRWRSQEIVNLLECGGDP
jgi:hypothetical protein